MISTQPPPSRLKSMQYSGTDLTIQFAKYSRTYAKVPPELAYKLFYSKTGRLTMDIYSKEIKGKFEVVRVV